ncbi:putative acetyltransferase [Paenimyroides aquimaris]|uniref:Putative acetyltransferase n=1 Tax=Paenimyroides marinum TaxID=1159016 RepID=A0A1H6LXW8_9FLAO|nr:acetyltransferase [Paenimyroides aquimaris]SEH91382.1 putative acetyltransferase [Paenimyroides aquimaris]
MKYKISDIKKDEYNEVIQVWEASVRATHLFLKEEDIQYFKPLILNTYLDAVALKCVKNETDKIIGFLGVAEQNLEMLFIHPDYRGKHVGKTLVNFAITEMNIKKVDVNEQNEQAVGFYKKCGFETINRSELDSSGKPYPILHMELKNNFY